VTGRQGGDARLVAELAGGATVVDAARGAGMSEATAYRRLRDDGFKRRIDEARAEILTRAVARLTHASMRAVETLEGLLDSEMDFCRLAAARSILDIGIRMREQLDISERLAALEQQLEARKP
jgi:hypothetical protein